jgi:KaiC/GvpD/RAD55 family RecA-like ATPase
MVKQELIQRSPVRLFEQSIQGGLKPGEVGIIASQSGVGKTSVLVQIALDKLLQNQKVIHVSFTQHTDYVLAWYEDIFNELVNKRNLEDAGTIKDELIRNRVLMNFSQDGVTAAQIIRSLRAMITDGDFKAQALIVDGIDFSRVDRERILAVREFAREAGLSVWYSCTVKGDTPHYDKRNIPLAVKDYLDLIDVVIVLEARSDHIRLTAPKDRESFNLEQMSLRLDPKTLLIQ